MKTESLPSVSVCDRSACRMPRLAVFPKPAKCLSVSLSMPKLAAQSISFRCAKAITLSPVRQFCSFSPMLMSGSLRPFPSRIWHSSIPACPSRSTFRARLMRRQRAGWITFIQPLTHKREPAMSVSRSIIHKAICARAHMLTSGSTLAARRAWRSRPKRSCVIAAEPMSLWPSAMAGLPGAPYAPASQQMASPKFCRDWFQGNKSSPADSSCSIAKSICVKDFPNFKRRPLLPPDRTRRSRSFRWMPPRLQRSTTLLTWRSIFTKR